MTPQLTVKDSKHLCRLIAHRRWELERAIKSCQEGPRAEVHRDHIAKMQREISEGNKIIEKLGGKPC